MTPKGDNINWPKFSLNIFIISCYKRVPGLPWPARVKSSSMCLYFKSLLVSKRLVCFNQTHLSGIQNCVVFSCREIKPYGRPCAKLTFFYVLLTVTHVCMAILTLCLRRRYASPLWPHICCCKTRKDTKSKYTSFASGSLTASFKSAHPYGKPYGHLTNIS